MNIVVCVEDKGGIAFNKRRLSRDKKVIEDLQKLLNGKNLYIRPESKDLFVDAANLNIKTTDSPDKISDGFFFADKEDPTVLYKSGDTVVIYRWNRRYPADIFFGMEQKGQLPQLRETVDFEGNSHEKITREIRQ